MKNMLFCILLSVIGLLFLMINFILFVSKIKKNNNNYKLLTIYLGATFLIELNCSILGYLEPNSNFFVSHFYFINQFVFMSLFFYKLFYKSFLKKTTIFILVSVLLFLTWQYSTTPSLFWTFNYVEIAVTFIPLIVYGLIYICKNLNKSHPYFYFCLGLVFYLSSTLGIFLSGNLEYVIFETPFFIDLWIFNSLFFILYQFLIFREWKILQAPNQQETL